MSVESLRDVSSSTESTQRTLSPRCSILFRRVLTSSSTSRRIPPSSRIELK
jgi:hypothetical protein